MQISQGEEFETQTDTETIPKLCNVVYQRLHKVDDKVTFMQVSVLMRTRSSALRRACISSKVSVVIVSFASHAKSCRNFRYPVGLAILGQCHIQCLNVDAQHLSGVACV